MTNTQFPILNSISNFPIPLTDRWGDYMERQTLETFWNAPEGTPAGNAYELLVGRYDKGEQDCNGNPLYHGCTPGDPRAFQHLEETFVAFWQDQVGIHSEIELEAEFCDLDEIPDDAPEELTSNQFEDLVATLKNKLEPLAEMYPETQFFIAHGEDVTYRGRVTINAFTPLLNGRLPNGTMLAPQSLALMVSPYFRKGPDAGEVNITACPCIVGLTDRLIDIAYPKTDAEAA